MAMELNLNLIKISKILVNKFRLEYKHSMREGSLVKQEASNTALIYVKIFLLVCSVFIIQ